VSSGDNGKMVIEASGIERAWCEVDGAFEVDEADASVV
jgi:hypothetical protein